MDTHRDMYARLVSRLTDADDDRLWETDPTAWGQARRIDDWLFAHRDNPAISLDTYERGCRALMALYGEHLW